MEDRKNLERLKIDLMTLTNNESVSKNLCYYYSNTGEMLEIFSL